SPGAVSHGRDSPAKPTPAGSDAETGAARPPPSAALRQTPCRQYRQWCAAQDASTPVPESPSRCLLSSLSPLYPPANGLNRKDAEDAKDLERKTDSTGYSLRPLCLCGSSPVKMRGIFRT